MMMSNRPMPIAVSEPQPKSEPNTRAMIIEECERLKDMLLAKNAAYGDSATNPVRIFSKANCIEQIKIRLDDKLSRLARGSAAGEDVEADIMGYLILLRVARALGRP